MQVGFLNEEVDKYIKFLQVGGHLLCFMLAVGARACCTTSTCEAPEPPCPLVVVSPGYAPTHMPSLSPPTQAVERETEHADQIHAQERLQQQGQAEAYEQQITEWKVKCFDEQYERYVCGSRGAC